MKFSLAALLLALIALQTVSDVVKAEEEAEEEDEGSDEDVSEDAEEDGSEEAAGAGPEPEEPAAPAPAAADSAAQFAGKRCKKNGEHKALKETGCASFTICLNDRTVIGGTCAGGQLFDDVAKVCNIAALVKC